MGPIEVFVAARQIHFAANYIEFCSVNVIAISSIQETTKRHRPGFVDAAGKLRQKC